jgi:hypothetical protein
MEGAMDVERTQEETTPNVEKATRVVVKHVIAMRSTKDRDTIWATCACGWESYPRPVVSQDAWAEVERRVTDEAAAHRRLGNEIDALGLDVSVRGTLP